MLAMQKLLEHRLTKAIALQAKYYNSKHLVCEYDKGSLIYLKNRNIDSTRPTKKLDQKFYGPYEVKKRIDKVAYRLKLLKLMKIHNVFHVSLLELCDQRKGTALPPLSIIVDNEKKYEVEKILDSRTYYSKLQYFIK